MVSFLTENNFSIEDINNVTNAFKSDIEDGLKAFDINLSIDEFLNHNPSQTGSTNDFEQLNKINKAGNIYDQDSMESDKERLRDDINE